MSIRVTTRWGWFGTTRPPGPQKNSTKASLGGLLKPQSWKSSRWKKRSHLKLLCWPLLFFDPQKKKPTPEIFSDSPKSTYIIYRYVYLNWSHQPTTSLSTSIVVIQPSPHHRLHLWIHELWPSTWDTLSTLCLCHWWGLLVSAAGTSPGEGKGRGTRNERA